MQIGNPSNASGGKVAEPSCTHTIDVVLFA